MTSAREAALRTLHEIFFKGAYSNLALKSSLQKYHAMEKNEKALMTNLVYGVVSSHYTLEYVIKKYSRIKPKKLAEYIRIILELGLYQLIYMDKIPNSAAVNESVKLAKRYGRSGSDRFVNAILRAFCRDECKIEYPKDILQRLCITYSYSTDMARTLIEEFGTTRAESIMKALNIPPPLLLRVNTLKITTEKLIKKLADINILATSIEGTLISSAGFDIGECDLYKSGLFSVQDVGAYNASIILDPKPGEHIIDMCAAPGGKSTHMAELMSNNGCIESFDIYDHKLKLIEQSATRLGINIISAKRGDGTVFMPELRESADRVLCDVPCSGWGIIRRKPDIKIRNNDIDRLPQIQEMIIKNGAEYVKSGGFLVYSTCTIQFPSGSLKRYFTVPSSFETSFCSIPSVETYVSFFNFSRKDFDISVISS